MAKHHEPFRALGPIDWTAVTTESSGNSTTTSDDNQNSNRSNNSPLAPFFSQTFSDAQTIIDSIPCPPALQQHDQSWLPATSRLRSFTDSETTSHHPPPQPLVGDLEHAAKIGTEWKEVKVGARENPMGISVYKLGAKDGGGSWFARRSLHDTLSFDKWKTALESEFGETMRVADAPGSGNIRGMGAERKVEVETCGGVGNLEVYQVSARFPGPTTARDFVTLILTSDTVRAGERGTRQFTMVSKPCVHPDCPSRYGFIRGTYESVEVIREVVLDTGASKSKRTRSSIDLRRHPKGAVDREFGPEIAIEWLMVTRSDPGGNVPRFLVERGTPSGILSDADKFLKWAAAWSPSIAITTSRPQSVITASSVDMDAAAGNDDDAKSMAVIAESTVHNEKGTQDQEKAPQEEIDKPLPSAPLQRATTSTSASTLKKKNHHRSLVTPSHCIEPLVQQSENDHIQEPVGFYGMISGAIGAASSVVTSRIPNNPFLNTATTLAPIDDQASSVHDSDRDGPKTSDGETKDNGDGHDENDDDDSSSIRTFTSAMEPSPSSPLPPTTEKEPAPPDPAPIELEPPTTETPSPPSLLSKQSTKASSCLSSTATATAPVATIPPTTTLPTPTTLATASTNLLLRPTTSSTTQHSLSFSPSQTPSNPSHPSHPRPRTLTNTKPLRKLETKRRKLESKISRLLLKSGSRDAAARAKAEREAAKLEAKYQKGLQKLEEQRVVEERRVEEKERQRGERASRKEGKGGERGARRMSKVGVKGVGGEGDGDGEEGVELQKVRSERDRALVEIEMLKGRVGELQGENTRLVAQMGRMGWEVDLLGEK